MKAAGYRRPFSVYKLFPGQSEDRAYDVVGEPAIDLALMSATATICTPAVDRDEEVILPDGIDYDSRYRLNPIVLWEHGFDESISTPIAKCEHPDGRLALVQSASELEGTAYFTNKVRESEQIFALIADKIVRATSVRVDPVPGTERIETRDGRRVLVMPKSVLIEWSWGCMGVNPETVRKCLDHGRLAGSPIAETIAKTLRPFAAVAKGNGIGWQPEEKDVKTKTTKTKTTGAPNPDEEPVDPALKPDGDATANPTADATVETEVEDTELDDSDEIPPSGQVLAAVHSSLETLIENIEGASNRYENPTAKEFLSGLVEQLEVTADAVEGTYGEVTGGKTLTKTESEDEAPVTEEDALKSWLASGKSRGFQLGGYGMQLLSLTKAKNLKPAQRRVLEHVCKHLRKVVADAKKPAQASKAEPAADKAVADGLGKVVDVFKTVAKDLSDLLPKK